LALPVNLCPLIKLRYSYAVTDICTFFAASELLLGETTCHGKKMFELIGRIQPWYIMHLPMG